MSTYFATDGFYQGIKATNSPLKGIHQRDKRIRDILGVMSIKNTHYIPEF